MPHQLPALIALAVGALVVGGALLAALLMLDGTRLVAMGWVA